MSHGSKPKPSRVCLLWFRQDLRLADNPALTAAAASGLPVVPAFIWAPEEEGGWPAGAASKWWLDQSLAALDQDLRAIGSRLILRAGPTLETLRLLVRQTGAVAIFWNRRYEPAAFERDQHIEQRLRDNGLEVATFNAALLHEPWTVQNKSGKNFQVFTAFWRRCLALPEHPEPLSRLAQVRAPRRWPASLRLSQLELAPVPDWAAGLRATWTPGEMSAARQLGRFVRDSLARYERARNFPAVPGTSRLSPHLHFGEISPRQIWHALDRALPEKSSTVRAGVIPAPWRRSQFAAELGWREFSHHLLHHFPHSPTIPLRAQFERFPWRANARWRAAWHQGKTGYPIVDAGMRELWATGWMHNRVRMIVASFLVKDLRIPWQEGARWFWDTLVDADLAQNTLGWQWVAGCGADAAPFFRIFNPSHQGEKFDPEGDYIRRWVPELARLPKEWIHKPHAAPARILDDAKVQLGKNYAAPIVNHAIAREVALESYRKIRQQS